MGSHFTIREASSLYLDFMLLHYKNIEDFADWHNLTIRDAEAFLCVARIAYEMGY